MTAIQPGDRCNQMRANHVVRVVRVINIDPDGDALVEGVNAGPLKGWRYFVPTTDLEKIR
jgi:hypothetical protein